MNRVADPWLLAAVSGRALAQSAARGGHQVVVLDFFGDRDTRAASRQVEVVAAPGTLRFHRRTLRSAAARLAPPERSSGLVYGSGFEGRIPLLQQLADGRRLGGNPISVLRLVRDPRRFFPLLDSLRIPHPDVAFAPVPDPAGWLRKHAGGAGGVHVQSAGDRPLRRGEYLQRRVPGRSRSLLFLADGRRALPLGCSEQWVSSARPGLPWLFGGAVGQVPLSNALASHLADRLDALVEATGLRGLNGIDFIQDGKDWWLLEVNPRPTATMELYDPDYPAGLFDAHLQAVQGVLPARPAPASRSRALVNLFAPAGGVIGAEFEFPEWCRDLPPIGSRVTAGDPVCTVHAEAADPDAATALVQERRREMEARLAGHCAAPVGS